MAIEVKRKMDKDTKEKYLNSCNDRIYEQLTFAETKNAILSGLLGAAIFGFINLLIDLYSPELLWLVIVLGVSTLSMIIALIISLSSFIPIVSALGGERNLYFYGDIAKFNKGKEYLETLEQADNLEVQLAEQNIKVSQIICRKHRKFSIALDFTIAALLPFYYFYMIIKLINK